MKLVILNRKLSLRVIGLFNSLIHYLIAEFDYEGVVMSKHNDKPVWITRDGVDVAVVISPEMFNELVEAQEELEDTAAVDAALRDEIEISGVKYVFGPDIDLDVEVVLDKQGNRLTEARAQEISREILRDARAIRKAQNDKKEE